MFEYSDIKTMIDAETLEKRISEIGEQISRDYAGKEVLVICVLKGAVMFMSQLVKSIKLPLEMDFMIVSSYGNSTVSSGQVRIIKDLDKSIEGKHVIIAEDIIDTGYTLACLMKNLALRNPASLEIAAMLSKPGRRVIECEAKYTCFTVEDKFIVGYGLDYNQKYRNLPFIGYFDV